MTREEALQVIEFLERFALSEEALASLYAMTYPDRECKELKVISGVKELVREYVMKFSEKLESKEDVLEMYSETFKVCLMSIELSEEMSVEEPSDVY